MIKAVLDSNQFVFGFRGKKQACVDVLKRISDFNCFAPAIILVEVMRQLKQLNGKNFASLARSVILRNVKIIDESVVPTGLAQKYKRLGLKEADAAIAAVTEFIDADFLVSENRHFLKELEPDNFKVLRADEFLELLKQ